MVLIRWDIANSRKFYRKVVAEEGQVGQSLKVYNFKFLKKHRILLYLSKIKSKNFRKGYDQSYKNLFLE
jgi:hypothetical protein